MEKILEKYGWEKVGIALILISAVIIGFSFFSLLSIDNESLSNAKKAVSDRISGKGIEREGSFQSIYTNKYYSISMPQGYVVRQSSPASGVLSSIRIISGSDFILSIEVYDQERDSLSSLESPFDNQNYQKSQELLPVGPTTIFTGKIPSEPQIFEKVALIKKDGIILRLILIEIGFEQQSAEAIFDKMLVSLR